MTDQLTESEESLLIFCADCDEEFSFPLTDSVFEDFQGLNCLPKRCTACEQALLAVETAKESAKNAS
jgi:hypothetical protein